MTIFLLFNLICEERKSSGLWLLDLQSEGPVKYAPYVCLFVQSFSPEPLVKPPNVKNDGARFFFKKIVLQGCHKSGKPGRMSIFDENQGKPGKVRENF